MEPLSETKWDLVLSGTGLPQSLLALALSRSDKKILHADRNAYYGGAEAALSLQDAEDWVQQVNGEGSTAFRNARITRLENADGEDDASSRGRLGFSRSYSLALAPQLIYTRSTLLSTLVSSKTYRQLEFLAVGSWWIYDPELKDGESEQTEQGTLRKIPAGREDVFADKSIDIKSKRSLIKFVRLAADPDAQAQAIEEHGDLAFGDYLSAYYGLSSRLQAALHALTLSPDPPSTTKTAYALPRILRHLASFGVFGTGFNAVIPKWGGTAEIAQVACRAGAVGGGVYMLGNALQDMHNIPDDEEQSFGVRLQNEGELSTKYVAGRISDLPSPTEDNVEPVNYIARSISVVSSPLESLFPLLGENGPSPAGSVVSFPHYTFADVDVPIYLIVHSSDTGECPKGQCVIYGSAKSQDDSVFDVLSQAVEKLLSLAGEGSSPVVLWRLQYLQVIPVELTRDANVEDSDDGAIVFPEASIDLAFDDSILKEVKDAWETITGEPNGFMQFEDREVGAYDDEDE